MNKYSKEKLISIRIKRKDRRILLLKNKIIESKALRGVGPGTFWFDIKSVNQSIQEMRREVKLIEKEISIMKEELRFPELMKELVASEIF